MLSSFPRQLVVKVRLLFHPLYANQQILITGSDLLMWTLIENYTNMDLAAICELSIDACLAALQLEAPVYSTSNPSELSYGRPLLAHLAIC
jgi:hypothetical protein